MTPKPSHVTVAYWMYARAPKPMRDVSPRVGKWLIFLPLAELDAAWRKIETSVKAGNLGPAAKTRTASPNVGEAGGKVICVYTRDADDIADRERVRRHLLRLGLKVETYRTDAETLAGRGCE
jgi:hypothetical protein